MSSTIVTAILTAFLSAADSVENSLNIRNNWIKPENDPLDPIQVQRAQFTIAVFLAHSIPFYAINMFFEFLMTQFPMSRLAPFRFNGTKMPAQSLIFKAVLLTTFYHVLTPILVWTLGFDFILKKNPSLFSNEALPSSIWIFLFQLFICYVTTDFLFYWLHRGLHEVPFAYQYIHKQHHEFIITVGWAAEYSNPIEWFLGNIVPVAAAPFLFNFHAVVWFSWLGIAIAGTTIAHSGFKHYDPFGGVKDSQIHDFHHTKQITNYGHTLFWDRICGTDKIWRNYWARKERGLKVDEESQDGADVEAVKHIHQSNNRVQAIRSSNKDLILKGSDNNVANEENETKSTKAVVNKRSGSMSKKKTTTTTARGASASKRTKSTGTGSRSGSKKPAKK